MCWMFHVNVLSITCVVFQEVTKPSPAKEGDSFTIVQIWRPRQVIISA